MNHLTDNLAVALYQWVRLAHADRFRDAVRVCKTSKKILRGNSHD